MRIAYLAAGAAGRYCGTCLHDNTLAAELRKQGTDILLVPTYTPLRTDEENVSQSRLFFGGLNVYLQQKSAIFRHTPWFFDALLDRPALVEWLSRRSSGMEAAELGELTVSTLSGKDGRQRKELRKLVSWLKRDVQPTIVHLSNVLLAGLAPALRDELGVPLVASLAGEDIFVEQLTEPHYSRCRALLKQQAKHIDRFVALNNYFADFMADYLEIPRSKIEVIPHGLKLDGHWLRPTPVADPARPTTIGYFARIAPEKGLHLLVEAYCTLAGRTDLPPTRLRIAGYMSSGDQHYYEQVRKRISAAGLDDRVEFVGEVDRAGKIAFLHSLDLMSVPTVYHESKGISVIEALANGVPVVVPRHGAFPELIETTGGGLLCEPLDPNSIAAAIERLVREPETAAAMGRSGYDAVQRLHGAERMAASHRELYAQLISSQVAIGTRVATGS